MDLDDRPVRDLLSHNLGAEFVCLDFLLPRFMVSAHVLMAGMDEWRSSESDETSGRNFPDGK